MNATNFIVTALDVSMLAEADISAGRAWEWRYEWRYETFPDYKAVLWRFWIWNAEYFRPEGARWMAPTNAIAQADRTANGITGDPNARAGTGLDAPMWSVPESFNYGITDADGSSIFMRHGEGI